MSNEHNTAGVAQRRGRPVRGRAVVAQVLILLALVVWAFWPELTGFARTAASRGNWAHGLVAPALILILVSLRRAALAAALTRGSCWGIVLLLLGFGLFAVFSWPFDYAYPRWAAVVPVCAGVILASCGWRVLKLCLPMLLLLLLSIPVGARVHARLVIRPETHTLAATRVVLDQLPGVDVTLRGPDLDFRRAGYSGTVALGEPHRGALLLVTYVAIGVFVVFTRIRPFWQVALLALAAPVFALLCNLARIICWGLIAIYANPDPTSAWPRAVSGSVSLVLAYLLFACGCWVLSNLIVETDEDDHESKTDNAAAA